jgi:hypothetical protein
MRAEKEWPDCSASLLSRCNTASECNSSAATASGDGLFELLMDLQIIGFSVDEAFKLL